ncbi:hypothetical protein [Glaciihabitans tibetensis]|nr:hypothetical protein [Glaciihabitans tibetensis]
MAVALLGRASALADIEPAPVRVADHFDVIEMTLLPQGPITPAEAFVTVL